VTVGRFVIQIVLILLLTCPLQAQTIEELANAEENYPKCAEQLKKAREVYDYRFSLAGSPSLFCREVMKEFPSRIRDHTFALYDLSQTLDASDERLKLIQSILARLESDIDRLDGDCQKAWSPSSAACLQVESYRAQKAKAQNQRTDEERYNAKCRFSRDQERGRLNHFEEGLRVCKEREARYGVSLQQLGDLERKCETLRQAAQIGGGSGQQAAPTPKPSATSQPVPAAVDRKEKITITGPTSIGPQEEPTFSIASDSLQPGITYSFRWHLDMKRVGNDDYARSIKLSRQLLQQEGAYSVSVYAMKHVNSAWQAIGWVEREFTVTRASSSSSDSSSSKYDKYLKPMTCQRSCEVGCSASRDPQCLSQCLLKCK
jgi:hypothetical protein